MMANHRVIGEDDIGPIFAEDDEPPGYVERFAKRIADKGVNDGGAAFPFFIQDDQSMLAHPGMTLLDWFAGRAMQSLVGEMANAMAAGDERLPMALVQTARLSYAIADAMLRERDRK